MIYTVTFNPALDYIVRVAQLNIGEVNRAAYGEIMAGGKGVNVSLVLKNLDMRVRLWVLLPDLPGKSWFRI